MLDIKGHAGGNLSGKILNLSGQIVHQWTRETEENQFRQKLDLTHLVSGIYFVQLETQQGQATAKLMIQ